MIILSHVDDLEIFATKHEFEDLVKKLESEGLKLKVEGPLEQGKGSIGFLKRTFTATFEGVDISMNAKYVESLEDVLELDRAFPKKLPVPADGGRAIHMKKGAQNPLTPEDHHLYRKGVGILLYLAPERPDLMFALKKLSMKLANPTEGDLELLRFVGKYLKGCPDIRLLHTTSYPGRSFQEKRNRSHEQVRKRDIYSQKSLIEICSDLDWAADRETRQSVSCGAIFVNGNMIHFQSKRQRSISLSSCESETIAAVSIMSEGIFYPKADWKAHRNRARSTIVHRFKFVKTIDFKERTWKSKTSGCQSTLDSKDEKCTREGNQRNGKPSGSGNKSFVKGQNQEVYESFRVPRRIH